jgi:hypothetical protein
VSVKEAGVRARISIRGPFRFEDASGNDLAPRLRKSRGLLALLATSSNFYRTRAWVQDKLWSDRGPDQGASSLRQSLTDIRRCLGAQRDLLNTDRTGIALRADAVDIMNYPDGIDTNAEYFEGLDVRDQEFDIWLTSLRANDAQADNPPMPKTHLGTPTFGQAQVCLPRQIVFHAQNRTQGEIGFVETALIELVIRNLREQADVEIYYDPPSALRPDALLAEVQCFASENGAFGIRSSIQTVADGNVRWSGTATLTSAPSFDNTPPELFSASARLSYGLINVLTQLPRATPLSNDTDANLLALLGMQKVFTLRAEEAAEAGRLLTEAFDRRPKGVYLAWLAQLNTIEFIEGIRPRDETADAAEQRIAQAIEIDPNNSQVLTVAANCTMVYKRDAQLAGHMAKMAVRANPANAMAWWVLAHIELYNGQYEQSYATSLRGQRLAHGTNLQYWLDFQRSIAAAFCGRMDEAQLLCQSTSALRPEFRAALRFSVMLHATANQTDLGARAVRRLQALEVGFSPERFVKDGDYPVGLFRRTPNYAPEKLLDLEF